MSPEESVIYEVTVRGVIIVQSLIRARGLELASLLSKHGIIAAIEGTEEKGFNLRVGQEYVDAAKDILKVNPELI